MNNGLAKIMNINKAVVFSFACNAVLIPYVIWSAQQAPMTSHSVGLNNTKQTDMLAQQSQTQPAVANVADKYQTIELTIAENQKFNQELQEFISHNANIMLVTK